MANKIKYGLKSVYYAKITAGTTGDTYGTPVALPGAISLSLAAQGGTADTYADNEIYYTSISNTGYSGDLELALVPDAFKSDILGEVAPTEGGLVEKDKVATNYFALMFQFEGDAESKRHCMFKCSATRPEVASNTAQESITPVTEKVTIKAVPNSNGIVKWTVGTASSAYTNWFTAVQVPTLT